MYSASIHHTSTSTLDFIDESDNYSPVFSEEESEDEVTDGFMAELEPSLVLEFPLTSTGLFASVEGQPTNPRFLQLCAKTLHAIRKNQTIPHNIIFHPFAPQIVQAYFKIEAKHISPSNPTRYLYIPLWAEAIIGKAWKPLLQINALWPEVVHETFRGQSFYELIEHATPPPTIREQLKIPLMTDI